MKPVPRLLTLSPLLLAGCHPGPQALPGGEHPDAQVVLAFLRAYGRRDLEGLMACLAEGATFVGTEAVLSRAQIRDFFQASFRKHPGLKVEVQAVQAQAGRVEARVRVETDRAWVDTWIFEVRDRRIRSYRMASGRR